VADVDELMVGSLPIGPALDIGAFDLDRSAATATYEMMVVGAVEATAVEGLAVLGA
jgi:hypothetical protein